MAIPSKQIGWSNESNLLWQIAKQIQHLTQVWAKKIQYINTLIPKVWSQEYYEEVLASVPSYVRPTDWLNIDSLVSEGDAKFVGLYAIYEDSNFLSLQVSGDYTINWGDGIIENYNSGVQSFHQYDWNNINFNGTVTSNGFKQAIITITPQGAPSTFTAIDLQKKHNQPNIIASSEWLDINVAGSSINSLSIGGTFINLALLESLTFKGTNLITNLNGAFYNCYKLKTVTIYTDNVTNMASMFIFCFNLLSFSFTNTSNVTTIAQMFWACNSLLTIPLLDTSKVDSMLNTFYSCTLLRTIPFLDTSNVLTMREMFWDCSMLECIPHLNTTKVTNMNTIFRSAVLLETIPLLDTSNVTSMANMFNTCTSLKNVPLLDTSKVVTLNSMFQSCPSLTTMPLFNTISCVDFTSMLSACIALENVPLLNTSNATDTTNMFANCLSLTTIPLLDTSKVLNMSGMLGNCRSLKTIPLLNTSTVTNMNSMFSNCIVLENIPLLDTSNVTNMNSMFNGCRTIRTIPLLNTSKVTSMNSMISNCSALLSLPLFDTSKVINASSMATFCYALNVIPAYNFTSATTLGSIVGPQNIVIFNPFNIRVTINLPGLGLSKTELEKIFNNLGNNVTARTIQITGNWGIGNVYTKTSSGTTFGSTLITQTDTSSLSIGQLVTGTGINSPRAITFTEVGSIVNLNSHGLLDGNKVAFATIVTTTGLTIKTIYYVVNKTTNNFQVSLTPGGSPIAFTNNGSGTVNFDSLITNIVPGVSFSIDKPATATDSQTLTIRDLNITDAILKGWTVTT